MRASSSELDSLPSRGAFTASELTPTTSASTLRPYVSASREPPAERARVKTDGTNILIRQLSQSRARHEAKRREQRAQAAAKATERAEALAEESRRRERERRAALEAEAKTTLGASPRGDACGDDAGGAETREGAEERATTRAGANPFSRKRSAASSAGTEAKRGRAKR